MKISHGFQFRLQVFDKCGYIGAVGQLRFEAVGHRQTRLALQPPLIGDQQDRLAQVEGGEIGMSRYADNCLGRGKFRIAESRPLPAEQDGAPAEPGTVEFACRFAWSELGPDPFPDTRGGGEYQLPVGNSLLHAAEYRRALQNPVGAGRHRARLGIGPTVPGRHESQVAETEIGHRASSCADVSPELRFYQHDCRRLGPGRRI